MAKPRVRNRVAIAFARNFAAGLVQNCEPGFQQDGTNLTDAEMDVVQAEIDRIFERLQASVNLADLEKCWPDQEQSNAQ